MPTAEAIPGSLEAVPAWMAEAAFWLAVALLLAAIAAAAGIWTLVARLAELRRQGERLAALDEVRHSLAALVTWRGDLDLRRLEHLLIDLRDTGRRLEDVLLRTAEGAAGATAGANGGGEGIGERVVNRLLALGYERVQVVTRPEELAALAGGDGEILVEARRAGVLHKGRIAVRGGRLADVDVQPAYPAFP
ncbi:MAG: hypothetical protein AB1726_05365 [Planctomycetota bacterium]